jgi:hypothetical protein
MRVAAVQPRRPSGHPLPVTKSPRDCGWLAQAKLSRSSPAVANGHAVVQRRPQKAALNTQLALRDDTDLAIGATLATSGTVVMGVCS